MKKNSKKKTPVASPNPATMEEKATSWRSRWGASLKDFASRFLPVFLGIVITFSGNAWLSRKREKNDVRQALTLVSEELKENLAEMKHTQEHIDLEDRAAKYLMRYYDNFEACHPDSMRLYCNMPLSVAKADVSDEALELLKNSALFQKIRDRELALNIIRAYHSLDDLADNYRYYNEKKQNLIDDATQKEAKAVFAKAKFTGADMWGAFTSTDDGRQFLHEITISAYYGFGYPETRKYVTEVVQQLDSIVQH